MTRAVIPAIMLMVLALLSACAFPKERPSERPNILLIVTDDQPATTVPHMPKLERLVAQRGVSFEHAYISDPLCCPSRATILTGKYTHNHGVTNNHDRRGGARKFHQEGLERDTIGTRLDEVGYATGYFGKWMNGYEGRHVPPGWDSWFAFSGDLNKPDFYDVNINGRTETFSRQHNETDLLRERTAAFVEEHRGAPWFAVVATHAPHGPYWPPQRHADSFDGVKLPKPPSFDEDDFSGKPKAYRRGHLSSEEKSKLRSAYEGKLEALQGVDDLVEELIDALEKTDQLGNTYVVYLTDNGYLLGEHRHEAKGKPYEGSIRTPLLVRGPGVPAGEKRGELVANVDLAPTIAEWADASPPEKPDGRSLAPLLSNSSTEAWRKVLLIEHFVGPNWAGLRTPRYSYIEHKGGESELYDLHADPHQLDNIYESADDALLEEMHARLEDLRDCAGADCRALENPALGMS